MSANDYASGEAPAGIWTRPMVGETDRLTEMTGPAVAHSSWSGWNDTLIKRLHELWNDGLSSMAIGRRLGCTKNAVIGKAHREGLIARRSPIQSTWFNEARRELLARLEAEGAKDTFIHEQLCLIDGPPVLNLQMFYNFLWKRRHKKPKRERVRAPKITLPRIKGLPDLPPDLPVITYRRICRAPVRPPPEPRTPRSPTCCYPLWGDDEAATHRYCDSPNVVGGYSYCAEHKALTYYKPPTKSYLPPITGSWAKTLARGAAP